MTAAALPPTPLRAWLLAARLRTLPAAVAPVLVGAALAYFADRLAALPVVAALLGALALQLASNFANDVFDHEKGADGPNRIGPARAVASGWISPAAMKRAMGLALLVALLVGVYLTAHAGWPVIAIGLASMLAAVAYTGGPLPLGYLGLGDVFVFGFFGPVAVLGTVFVQTPLTPLLWRLGLASAVGLGALATAILVVNNIRDHQTDRVAGKRTLAVRLGPRFARLEYVALLALAYAATCYLALRTQRPWLLLPLATLPVAGLRIRALYRATAGAAYNQLLGHTAQLMLLYGACLALALVLARGA